MIITAPERKEINKDSFSVFLAGTIDSGNSENWQKIICDRFEELIIGVTFFNPRRDVWPSDSDHNEVKRQIQWELEHLDKANLIIMNILPNSKSPISLMEIGMYANSGKLVVFCQENFYRFDNVEEVCNKYNVKLIKYNDITLISRTIIEYYIRNIITELTNSFVVS